MRCLTIAAAILLATSITTFAADNNNNNPGGYRPAPGPLVGAGLPALAIGYGVYWLVKRRRKAD